MSNGSLPNESISRRANFATKTRLTYAQLR
jgi:hypothetical protein